MTPSAALLVAFALELGLKALSGHYGLPIWHTHHLGRLFAELTPGAQALIIDASHRRGVVGVGGFLDEYGMAFMDWRYQLPGRGNGLSFPYDKLRCVVDAVVDARAQAELP